MRLPVTSAVIDGLHPQLRRIFEATMALGATPEWTPASNCYTSRNGYGSPSGRLDVTIAFCTWPNQRESGRLQPTGPDLYRIFDALGIDDPWQCRRDGEERVREIQIFNHPTLTPNMGADGRGIVVAVPLLYCPLAMNNRKCRHIWMEAGNLKTDLFG